MKLSLSLLRIRTAHRQLDVALLLWPLVMLRLPARLRLRYGRMPGSSEGEQRAAFFGRENKPYCGFGAGMAFKRFG